MPPGGAFRVAIKDSAASVLEGDLQPTPDETQVLEFKSRHAAEESIDAIEQTEAGSFELQQPAPNDSDDVDAYLVFYPETRKRSPDGSLTDGWAFDTTANQYGAIGEALITAPGTTALEHFVRQDLADTIDTDRTDRLHIDCKTSPGAFDWETLRSAAEGEQLRWIPDCEVLVRLPDRRGSLHRYFCEIKTGDASFQRNQATDMTAVSEVADVLKIRVRIDELPDEYSVTFNRVGDSSLDVDVTLNDPAADTPSQDQAGLRDFLD